MLRTGSGPNACSHHVVLLWPEGLCYRVWASLRRKFLEWTCWNAVWVQLSFLGKGTEPRKMATHPESIAILLFHEGRIWFPPILSIDLFNRSQKKVQSEIKGLRWTEVRSLKWRNLETGKLCFVEKRGLWLMQLASTVIVANGCWYLLALSVPSAVYGLYHLVCTTLYSKVEQVTHPQSEQLKPEMLQS